MIISALTASAQYEPGTLSVQPRIGGTGRASLDSCRTVGTRAPGVDEGSGWLGGCVPVTLSCDN